MSTSIPESLIVIEVDIAIAFDFSTFLKQFPLKFDLSFEKCNFQKILKV